MCYLERGVLAYRYFERGGLAREVCSYIACNREQREREKKRKRMHELPPRLLILLLRMARLLGNPL
jgi:hypothetical protein